MKTATIGADHMNGKFIYVFDENAKDALIKAGFVMLKNDEESSLFIFIVDDSIHFDFSGIEYVVSDTLTF